MAVFLEQLPPARKSMEPAHHKLSEVTITQLRLHWREQLHVPSANGAHQHLTYSPPLKTVHQTVLIKRCAFLGQISLNPIYSNGLQPYNLLSISVELSWDAKRVRSLFTFYLSSLPIKVLLFMCTWRRDCTSGVLRRLSPPPLVLCSTLLLYYMLCSRVQWELPWSACVQVMAGTAASAVCAPFRKFPQ